MSQYESMDLELISDFADHSLCVLQRPLFLALSSSGAQKHHSTKHIAHPPAAPGCWLCVAGVLVRARQAQASALNGALSAFQTLWLSIWSILALVLATSLVRASGPLKNYGQRLRRISCGQIYMHIRQILEYLSKQHPSLPLV